MTNIIDLTKRVREFRDTYRGIDELGACDLLDEAAHVLHTLGADLYKAEGQRDSLAQKLESANGCISDWVTFGSEVTDALGLRVMSPKDIKAQIQRLTANAARYRYLRWEGCDERIVNQYSGEGLDAAVDAAMQHTPAPGVPAIAEDGERAAFEAWAIGAEWAVVEMLERNGDDYRNQPTQEWWDVWKASAAVRRGLA